ncbi:MAG: hypothetical protein ACFE85_09940 [Candidatus Hodarchaeota archaeon]
MNDKHLDREETEVYNLVKKYLKKKPFFSILDIKAYLNYYLRKKESINKDRIENILKSLIEKNLIIPGAKLIKENVLKNPKRSEIYRYICNNPGSNINDIKNQLKMGSNQVLWHLKFLTKFQFIRHVYFDNQKIFFKFESNEDYDKFFYYLRNESVIKILKLLKSSNESINPTRISKLLKMHYYTLVKYLDILSHLNLIILDDDQNSYNLNQEVYTKILGHLKKILE